MKKNVYKNIHFEKNIKKIFEILPRKNKKYYYILFFGLLMNGFLETITAGIIAFYVSAISDPINILNTKFIILINANYLNNKLNNYVNIILLLSIFIIFVVCIKNTLKALLEYYSERYSASISAIIGKKLITGFLNTNYEWYLYKNTADVSMIVLWRKYYGAYVRQYISLQSDIIIVILLMLTVFFVTPIVSLCVVVVIGLTSVLIFKRIKVPLDKVSKLSSKYNLSIHKNTSSCMNGLKDVKIFGCENFFINLFSKEVNIYTRLSALQKLLSVLPTLILETIGIITLLVVVIILFFLLKSTVIKITGTLALLAVTAWRVIPAINRILSSLTKIRTFVPYIQKIFENLNEIYPTGKNINDHLSKTINFKSYIQFSEVFFKYQKSDNYALENINFTIKKSQMVGIVGISGSGKSTLVDLLIGLLNINHGKIFIDGKTLNKIEKKQWFKNFGYVPQTPFLLDGTIRDNISFGIDPDEVDQEILIKSSKMSSMNDFISELKDGIDTFIGERGVRLSGGQRQRISMARALYRDPEIIIFDEATSALDSKNEFEIINTIRNLKDKKTIIIIAHSLESVVECDWIIWLDKGRIVRQGPANDVISEYRIFLDNINIIEK
ncbi:ATP-binding cassette domain-containing protein [uncultured Desulfosarcina sp.]|uniref:ABC transporter ATP-binding protein n=1 Tax=uncultured Desulfosarcina sp. TaxID=218289 RepID=UPI0029C86B9F|nr:ATP-binding cassette domain-containing protein [uncultured Desulfosarcina sp.]